MIRNNKRGFLSDMHLAVLALVAIVVLSLFLYKSYDSLKEKMSLKSCKDSIEAHRLVSKGTFNGIFTDIKCPTNEIEIKSSKDSKKIIAQDMQRCWYIWGKGEGTYFEGDGNFCHVCSIYEFDTNAEKIDGLMTYLYITPITARYPGDASGMTYADYLSGSQTGKAAELIGREIETLAQYDTIDTSKKYATIYVYSSDKNAMQRILNDGTESSLGTTGLFGIAGGAGAVGIGLFVVSNPVGWVVGGVGAIVAGVKLIQLDTSVENIQFVAFRPYDAAELDKLQCQQINVNAASNDNTYASSD